MTYRDLLSRGDVSWKAKGIMVYLLSSTNHKDVSPIDLLEFSKESEKSIRSGWKELEVIGLVKRYPVRDGQRISHWETTINKNLLSSH